MPRQSLCDGCTGGVSESNKQQTANTGEAKSRPLSSLAHILTRTRELERRRVGVSEQEVLGFHVVVDDVVLV